MAIPFLKWKIFNKSIVSPTSENSEPTTLEEIKFIMDQVRSAGETYMKRMIEWMVLHPGDFPSYVTPDVLLGQLPERGNPYFGSLVTPKQPYAYRRRLAMSNRDLGNVGWYDDGTTCAECGPNMYRSKNA